MDLNAVINQLSQMSAQSAQDIQTKMANADPNNPEQ